MTPAHANNDFLSLQNGWWHWKRTDQL